MDQNHSRNAAKLSINNKSLSNICNIAHVKAVKNIKFLLKNNNYLLKS